MFRTIVIAMTRTVWLAFICLVAVSALFAVRTGTGARVIPMGTASLPGATPSPSIYEEPPLAKADRLPIRQFLAAPERTVSTTEIAPTPELKIAKPAVSVSESKTESHEVTSWHWHAGSKVTKRTTVTR
jgi:hypothetical protein